MVDWSLVISIVALGISLLGYIHNRRTLANANKRWSTNRLDTVFADARQIADELSSDLEVLKDVMSRCKAPLEERVLRVQEPTRQKKLKSIETAARKLDARLGSHQRALAFQSLRHATEDVFRLQRDLLIRKGADQRAALIAQLASSQKEWKHAHGRVWDAMHLIQEGSPKALGPRKRSDLGLPPFEE